MQQIGRNRPMATNQPSLFPEEETTYAVPVATLSSCTGTIPSSADLFLFDDEVARIGKSRIIHADCLTWFHKVPPNTLHAVVTDPPYGVKEYDCDQLEKRENGKGGIWRIPPSFDGHQRSPLPRFTALDDKERNRLTRFFVDWGGLVLGALRPGGHVLIATNAFISQLLYSALVTGGLEFRGEVIRLVRTLRRRGPPEKRRSGICRRLFDAAGAMSRGASSANRCCRK